MNLSRHHRWSTIFVVCAILSLNLFACQAQQNGDSAASATPEPTPTFTPEPLGSEGNPVILGLVPAENAPDQAAQAATLAEKLSSAVGFSVNILVVDDYESLLAKMQAGSVHLVFLQPITYITAHQNQLADVALLTNHFGVYYYGAQFLANIDSGFSSYFDPNTNSNTADAATALGQLNGAKPCWADPTSVSGYILPAGILAQNEITVANGATLLSQTGIIRALYIKGICDFGVTFAISGDPRTSSAVINDLPDVRERVMILWQSDPVIPNLNLSYTPALPAEMRSVLTQTFLDLVKSDDGKALLAAAAGDYEIQDMRVVDDSVYDPLRSAVDALGLDVYQALGK
ncbi:ABC-type phosphate/phosphonate transport system, periplasmic component [Longilinea arvoryzae]|uniref:ABC-type phosphate/phosphonate transport system, periplasmic component n=1 Tax=Longilinea arvoryzae TaxID=360412 RepID=A0A0S7BAG1_9CHLR|nr:PhnD/SsuA/transferrin family substrate-binding protein [Longilinea arvoryzae]GAP14430.1 ABC-type phosphate/phosphonate transport system, periplasmic component [Longilinea arvoryzae]